MKRTLEGFQTAYCPKFSEDRRIAVSLIESVALGDIRRYGWTRFNCPEYQSCEHVIDKDCPFLIDVLSRFARR